MGNFRQFFLQTSKITCLQMENFVVAILYLVYFALKYMYFEDLWLKSREILKMMATYGVWPSFSEIHEHGGNIVCWESKTAVCKFPKMMATLWPSSLEIHVCMSPSFSEIHENPEKWTFFATKKVFLGGSFMFSSPELVMAGEICKKTHSIWSIWAPRALFVIFPPPIWGFHPVLDFHTQITRKSSTAMC